MIGEGIARLAATTEPDVKLSRHPASEQPGHCQEHYGLSPVQRGDRG
jgi:hypothetical protein